MIPRVAMPMHVALLGGMLDDDSWIAWRTLLIAAMGEPLAERERTIFRQFTGREREPGERVEECAIVKGRRAGGSRSVSVLAAYIAGLCEHPALVPGERGVLLIVAADQRQADVVLLHRGGVFRLACSAAADRGAHGAGAAAHQSGRH